MNYKFEVQNVYYFKCELRTITAFNNHASTNNNHTMRIQIIKNNNRIMHIGKYKRGIIKRGKNDEKKNEIRVKKNI